MPTMTMIDLAALFHGLNRDKSSGTVAGAYVGSLVPGTEHHVARDDRGRPALLLHAVPTDVRPASIVLENLRIEHGIRCTITSSTGDELDARFTVVQCQTEDPLLQRYFLDLCEVVLANLPDTPSQRDIADRFDQIALLFRALEEPSRRSVQGLWGELFLIVSSQDPAVMVEGWHDDACERYDFASGEQRLEVKTSSTRTRLHHFSFEQVSPAPSVQCVVASLFVEPSTGGRTLGSLWDEARQLVRDTPQLRARIDQVAFESLGSHWTHARTMAFDEQLASSSLCFYDVRDIPHIPDVPAGVSEVRFCSDLATATPLVESERPLPPLVSTLTNGSS